MADYEAFLAAKRHLVGRSGFEPTFVPDYLFNFQRDLVEWTCRLGRAAVFADCGLGKTPVQLVWAQNVVERTNRPVLVLAPLAVTSQTIREAEKFGIVAVRSRDGVVSGRAEIVVTNYERLHYFDRSRFAGVVCDESGILKNFDGATKTAVTEFVRMLPYRLLCTATAAPNDYIEFGTSSEALGHLGYIDMLGMFFKNDEGSIAPLSYRSKWRFKPHAERPFWRWLVSWARLLRKPSDLGYADDRFRLPPIDEHVDVLSTSARRPDLLFAVPARTLDEQRAERRLTIEDRCGRVVDICRSHARPYLVWCHLNDEGDLLERLLPDAVQVSGADSDDAKVEKFEAFATGRSRGMITKPRIGGFGLNWQHCADVAMFPSHCYDEQTEVLTKRGWKIFGDVSLDDYLATVNKESLSFEWQAPSDVIWSPYAGPMISFIGERNFDLLVTPNHKLFVQRCPIRYRSSSEWALRNASDVSTRFRRQEYRMLSVPLDGGSGTHPAYIEVPIGPRYSRSRTLAPIAVDDFMRLAGWYLTEGCVLKRRGKYIGSLIICQTDKHPEYRDEIISLLKRLGLHVNYKTKDIGAANRDLSRFLVEQFGSGSRHKAIPRWVKDLDPALLVILRDTMMKGDGSATGMYYKSFSAKLRDDFQEICLRTGWRASVHCDYVSVAKRNIRPAIHKKPEIVDYVGMIGCATVPNGTLIVRRRGIPVVSGNSFEQYYQCVRRCWRFGQTRPVTVSIVTTEGEADVLGNLRRKAAQADRLFEQAVALMHEALGVSVPTWTRSSIALPPWVSSAIEEVVA